MVLRAEGPPHGTLPGRCVQGLPKEWRRPRVPPPSSILLNEVQFRPTGQGSLSGPKKKGWLRICVATEKAEER